MFFNIKKQHIFIPENLDNANRQKEEAKKELLLTLGLGFKNPLFIYIQVFNKSQFMLFLLLCNRFKLNISCAGFYAYIYNFAP